MSARTEATKIVRGALEGIPGPDSDLADCVIDALCAHPEVLAGLLGVEKHGHHDVSPLSDPFPELVQVYRIPALENATEEAHPHR